MDAISTLDIAACILTATESITELLSPSRISQAQLQLSKNDDDEPTILEALGKFRSPLFDAHITAQAQQPSTKASGVSRNAPALQDLISSRDAVAALLEDLVTMLGQSSDGPSLQPRGPDTGAWLRSRLTGTPFTEKLHHLSLTVTRHVSFTLRYVAHAPAQVIILFKLYFRLLRFLQTLPNTFYLQVPDPVC